jgi:hypothetical protein
MDTIQLPYIFALQIGPRCKGPGLIVPTRSLLLTSDSIRGSPSLMNSATVRGKFVLPSRVLAAADTFVASEISKTAKETAKHTFD